MDDVTDVLIAINVVVGAISVVVPFVIGGCIGYFGSSVETKDGD